MLAKQSHFKKTTEELKLNTQERACPILRVNIKMQEWGSQAPKFLRCKDQLSKLPPQQPSLQMTF